MDMTGKKKVDIFCCYAREDQGLLLTFKKHLKPLEWQGLISLWSDIDINAGMNWESEIHKHLNSAQIILLFVSPDFMHSDYCYSTEMQRALERHELGEALVIPIILRPISWKRTPLGKLQALPANAEPVTSRNWHTPDDAFFNIVESIEHRVEALLTAVASVVPGTPQSVRYVNDQRPASAIMVEAAAAKLANITSEDRTHLNKFTDQALKVLNSSREEAQRFQHNYIGTEHLLLGLLRESDGVAARVLGNLGVELNKVRRAVEFIVGRGDRIVLGEIGLTPRSKEIIKLAIDEAGRLNHSYIGTEHLLLGLAREGEGIAMGILESLSVNAERVRTQTLQIILRPSH